MSIFGRALLEHSGAPPEHAGIVMEHLVRASSMGLASHGVMRIPQYLAEIEAGIIDPAAEPEIEQTGISRLRVEGRRGFGQVVGMRMVGALTQLVRETGVAMANGRHLGHTGRIGAYAEALAEGALIGLAMCNGAPSGHWVAPFGGREGRISTNPMAMSWPVDGEKPVVADFSTAAAPEGVIRVLRDQGAEAPEGALRDAEGRVSRDPNVLYALPKGAVQPLGGKLGFRGTALALFVEILTTLLNGDEVDDRSRKGTDMTLLAIAPQPGFASLAQGLSEHIRRSPPLQSGQPVLMPGDREYAAMAATRLLHVDGSTWEALKRAAGRAGLTMPKLAEGEEQEDARTDGSREAEAKS
ncbi:MAG TPA: Ldh family oxidoreductase [Acetobacteraceae bacterium]|nr:Ldh family oxidoreductase [Acetobacteraceae bacterium]